jgi:DNA polymerase III epsilon subunit-like protein
MNSAFAETYISVDVETAGPNPSDYSLLSIGACTLEPRQQTFYGELAPVNDRATPEALAVSGLSLQALREHGLPPGEAMAGLARWVEQVVPEKSHPVFVAFNAPFDWMFVHDYFMRYLGYNPFGHSALDMKALYMGLTGVRWHETSMRHVSARYLDHRHLTHHALQDALDQAEILSKLLEELRSRR